MDLQERVLSRVERTQGCWSWKGYIGSNGYGTFSFIEKGKTRNRRAYRMVYEYLVGPVSSELDLDHLCENRWCVNPAHLEPVTRGVNVARGLENQKWKNQIRRWHDTGRWESGAAAVQRAKRERISIEVL